MARSLSNTGRSDRLVIAAIDLGTTYSGYAYTFKHELERERSAKDMCKVLSNNWQSGSSAGLISHKTPTSLLLTKDGEFDSFGYKAEKNYMDLVNGNKHIGWRFYRKFKMLLHKNDVLNKNTTIKDDQGNSYLALEIFAHSIRFLKTELIQALHRENVQPIFVETDIQWVITIPAIWDPKSKDFMRVAAEEAGIERDRLEFALEPEAASVYVKEMLVTRTTTDNEAEIVPFEAGTQYMVLDLGGGTIDVVVKEVREDRTLRELHHAFGNGLGGESVNKRFIEYFENAFGIKLMTEFRTNNAYRGLWLDFETEIEIQKRNFASGGIEQLKLNISSKFLELFENSCGKSLSDHCTSIEHLSSRRDKLNMHKDLIVKLFQPSIDSIIQFMRDVFDKKHLVGVSDIIMVGGFSQCKLITDKVKETFRGLNIVIPHDADLAVLKGAVIYRHWPEVIYSRRAPFSLGARFNRIWLDGDDISKQFRNTDGEKMCMDCFSKFVTKDEEFASKDKATLEVYPICADTTVMPVEIFKSDEENPRYTTDPSCKSMGNPFNVDMSDLRGGMERKVHVTLTMGSTEIRVEGQQIPNGEVKKIQLNLLKD